MTPRAAIARLVEIAATFGAVPAAEKRRLLDRILGAERLSARDLRDLHDAVCFLRAYPDDARVRRLVEAAVARLREWRAGSETVRDEYSLPMLARMAARFPGCLEIDWDELDSQDPLVNALGLFVTSPECQGLDDIGLQLQDWFAACRPARMATDLEFLLFLFESGRLDPAARNLVFEGCAVPIRFELTERGTERCENLAPSERVHYQRRPLDRKRHAIAPATRRSFPSTRRASAKLGEEIIGLGLTALCSRNLEIRTLSHANPLDVTVVDGGRGLRIALVGVVPAFRDPLESHYCVLVFKNGVPIAYGPGTVSLGCCEVGINLFPEFRGAEIRYLYPQFLRALHRLLGAEYFFLTPYGMGEDNPAAIRTGAFWFYRKLGFRPTNPTVEALAVEEEQRMAREPGVRSTTAMLRRLSHTSAFLDLSGGACRPLDLGAIGVHHSRFISERFAGDRGRAVREPVSRVARALGFGGEVRRLPEGARRAWEMLAPLLAMIPELDAWSPRDKKKMLRILEEKGGASERGVDRLLRSHRPFVRALRGL